MKEKNAGLRDYLQVLRKRRTVVLCTFGGIFTLILIGSLLATPIYEGTAQIIIEQVEGDNLSGANRSQPRDPEFEKTQFQLIRSHAVARRVVSNLNLENDFETLQNPSKPFLGAARQQLGSWVRAIISLVKPASDETDQEAPGKWSRVDLVAQQLGKNVRVRPLQGSRISEISYVSANPEFSAQVANAYVQAYLEETMGMKMEATRRNLEWMTQKAEDERLKLQVTDKRLQQYMEDHDLVTIENRVAILPESLSQLGSELVRAETRTKEYQLLYDKARSASGDLDAAESVLAVSEGSSLDVLRAQILRAEQNNVELSGKYGAKHPVMLKALADLNVLKDKRRQEINRIIQKLRNQYELARANENSIRAQLNETKSTAMELNEKYVQYNILKREIETNRQLYDALLTKIKDQSITGETRPVNIWVVEKAKVPLKPIKPLLALNLMLGLVVGLCVGIGSAFLVDHLDNRIKSPEGLEEALGVAILGTVSFNQQADSINEVVRTAPRSEFAESFNALRTTLLLASAEAPPKRILVTSSIAGEGKTTTAVNLAMAMAKAGSRVLLIDADLRRPTLHKVFNLRNRNGLSNYLAGAAGQSILCKSSHDNLTLIPAGPVPPNPYELLNSTRMSLLLENLGQEFDAIICDTPPVMAVVDSRVLSRFFDGLVLVARAGLTTYPMALASIKLLQDVNARIFGVLVNAVHARDQEYYRYYSSYLEESEKPGPVALSSRLKAVVGQDK